MSQRKFTQQEREAAVARVVAGERPTAVARDLGMSVGILRRWRLASGHATSHPGRTPDGRFSPGYTPNPGGSTTNIERAQRALEEAAPRLTEGMCNLALEMLDEKEPARVRLLADKIHALHKLGGGLLDRVLGKAAQRIKLEADAPLDADRLATLRAKLLPPLQGPQDPTARQDGVRTEEPEP